MVTVLRDTGSQSPRGHGPRSLCCWKEPCEATLAGSGTETPFALLSIHMGEPPEQADDMCNTAALAQQSMCHVVRPS